MQARCAVRAFYNIQESCAGLKINYDAWHENSTEELEGRTQLRKLRMVGYPTLLCQRYLLHDIYRLALQTNEEGLKHNLEEQIAFVKSMHDLENENAISIDNIQNITMVIAKEYEKFPMTLMKFKNLCKKKTCKYHKLS